MSTLQSLIKAGAILLAVFIIFVMLNVCLGICSIFFGVDSKEPLQSYSENFNNVTSLDIDISLSNVEIKKGENFKIEATDVNKSFKIKQEGSKIKVTEKANWFKNRGVVGSIVIYVPNELDKLDVDTGAGKIEISNIVARDLDIDAGAGMISISHSEFASTDIEGGAGQIDITSSTLRNLALETGVGKVSIQGMILGSSKIECGVGEVSLDLTGSMDDYEISLDKGIGAIFVNGKEYKGKDKIGNGKNYIKIEGGIGSINLNIAN